MKQKEKHMKEKLIKWKGKIDMLCACETMIKETK